MRGEHETERFDRDRWMASVAGRTLLVTVPERDRSVGQEAAGRTEPVECGLCETVVLPLAEGDTECCPICGFAV